MRHRHDSVRRAVHHKERRCVRAHPGDWRRAAEHVRVIPNALAHHDAFEELDETFVLPCRPGFPIVATVEGGYRVDRASTPSSSLTLTSSSSWVSPVNAARCVPDEARVQATAALTSSSCRGHG